MKKRISHHIISLILISALLLSACGQSSDTKSAEEYEAEIAALQLEIEELKAQAHVSSANTDTTVDSSAEETDSAAQAENIQETITPDTETPAAPAPEQEQPLVSEFVEIAEQPEAEDRTQIVVFGDSIWDSTRDETGVAHLVSQYMNADVYNCAIGGTKAAITTGHDTDNYDSWTSTSLIGMVNAAIGLVDPNRFLTGYVAGGVMQNIDFSQTDYFIIAYGLNDYFSATSLDHDYNDYWNVTNYRGALNYAIDRLRNHYPQAQILLISPTYCQFWSEGTDGNTKDFGGGTCQDYFFVAQNTSQLENTLFIDAYVTLGINGYNAREYLADGIHLNAAGRELYAKAVSSCLKYGKPGEVSGNSIHY